MNKFDLTCEGLTKSFSGKDVFKNLSFKISSEQSLSVTGKNGSGKSTLIKIISNLIRESSGKISILKNNIDLPREGWFNNIGLVSAYLNLYDELTGFENLNFFFKLKSSDSKTCSDKIISCLRDVNLYENRNKLVKHYSSGMKQRLKIAFAIMNEPQILLMDEPKTNLDKFGIDVLHKIASEQKQKGILIIATNDDDDRDLCDATINMENYN